MSKTFEIRLARREDVPAILDMIRALADYEHLSHEVEATEVALAEHLFGERPYVEALMAESEDEAVGFALYFHNYSTFLARPGIYLEDLFVRQTARGQGIGRALLVRLAQLAVERGCGRLEWSVLDWNAPAIAFYESLGAELKREWIINRVAGSALHKLGQS